MGENKCIVCGDSIVLRKDEPKLCSECYICPICNAYEEMKLLDNIAICSWCGKVFTKEEYYDRVKAIHLMRAEKIIKTLKKEENG